MEVDDNDVASWMSLEHASKKRQNTFSILTDLLKKTYGNLYSLNQAIQVWI